MKPKHLALAIVALLTGGGLWLVWPSRRPDPSGIHSSSREVGFETPTEDADTSGGNPGENPGRPGAKVSLRGHPNPGQMLRPPEPNRRFTDFTPEQRVEFARKGHGPGG